VTGLGSTLATIWRLCAPYFSSEDRWAGRGLFASLIAIELAIVFITVQINSWYARFYNAMQEYNLDAFVREVLIFCALVTPYVVIAVYQTYLNQWLQIRWRKWMTKRYLSDWLDGANHYRMQLLGDSADNPDQRIAEDIRLFVENTLDIVVRLLGAVVSLASFIVILWGLSEQAPLTLFGMDWPIPGYLVWAALVYSAIGTMLTHLIGRALISLNFNQQRYEADFRFNLVRAREHSEQIALMGGDTAERERLMERFANVVENWGRIMSRTKRLTFFTFSFTQASVIFPYVVVGPIYFAKHLGLGLLTQTASAFNHVQSSLSFFVTFYSRLAEWRAIIERLSGFEAAIAKSQKLAQTKPFIAVDPRGRASELHIDALDVRLPSGAPLVTAPDVRFMPGDRALVTGLSGSGKSTLFRAIGGIWPFGAGTIVVPDGARVMVLPQKPYLPVGSLAAAASYPATPSTFAPQQVCEVLAAVGLPALVPRIAEEGHWERTLSPGEQQRLAIARAILQAPDFLFLDEATASLDETAEAMLYRLLHERLPRTTIVSIGHRSTLHAFHRRHLRLDANDSGQHEVREDVLQAAK
jgi:putative ATP-binding cassette transporter